MRLRRRKLDITPSEHGRVWPLLTMTGLALLLLPGAVHGGLYEALSTVDIPAVLLTCGLLSALAERYR